MRDVLLEMAGYATVWACVAAVAPLIGFILGLPVLLAGRSGRSGTLRLAVSIVPWAVGGFFGVLLVPRASSFLGLQPTRAMLVLAAISVAAVGLTRIEKQWLGTSRPRLSYQAPTDGANEGDVRIGVRSELTAFGGDMLGFSLGSLVIWGELAAVPVHVTAGMCTWLALQGVATTWFQVLDCIPGSRRLAQTGLAAGASFLLVGLAFLVWGWRVGIIGLLGSFAFGAAIDPVLRMLIYRRVCRRAEGAF